MRRAVAALALLLAALLAARAGGAASAALQPSLALDGSAAAGALRSVSFTEGGPPVSLATATTVLLPTALPCVSAVVRITNPLDAPLELLAVAPEFLADVAASYDASAGVLTLTVAAAQLTGAAGTDPTGALRGALSRVTYAHMSLHPDASPRAVVFTVQDAAGTLSQPAVAVVTIIPVNNPPQLTLAGPAGAPGSFAAVLLESERVTPVAIADPALLLSDVDNDVFPGLTVTILGRLDGAAETLSADVSGTSIAASFDAAAGVLSLSGLDAVGNYAAALGSVRYRNGGAVGAVGPPGRVPAATLLTFTPGVRTLVVLVRDGAGGTAADNATVTCVATPRAATLGRDPTLPPPPDCSGNGTLLVDSLTGDTSCACSLGFEGDACEIPPCNGNGAFSLAKAQAGLDACTCTAPWSGPTCGVACLGVGAALPGATCRCNAGYGGIDCSLVCAPPCPPYGTCGTSVTIPVGGRYPDGTAATCRACWLNGVSCASPCPCFAGGGGAHGVCVASADQMNATCRCDAGWAGADCSVACPACVAPGGACAAPAQLAGGLTALMAALNASVAATGGTASGVALLSGFNATGAVVGIAPAADGTAVFVADGSARILGECVCSGSLVNRFSGAGYTGADCSIPCRPCVQGTCSSNGTCACAPGYTGAACDAACSGHGVVTWPTFGGSVSPATWDVQYGPNLGGPYTTPGGLFDTRALYGVTAPDNSSTLAYCACASSAAAGGTRFGYTGPFCAAACPDCGAHGSCVTDATGAAACACSATDPNTATTSSALALAAGVSTGVGWAGPLCNVPCKPCLNGTCTATGACACAPGYADDACALECGAEGLDAPTGYVRGKRGTLARLGALPGYGLNGSAAVCVCDVGWAGPMCTKPCADAYDPAHGVCVLKNASEPGYGAPWAARVVCAPGWAAAAPTAPPGTPGLNCSRPCSPCAAGGGECQDGGECLCGYDRLWQGPLPSVLATYPYPQLALPRTTYNATWHSCAERHPCSRNGEYINATCAGTLVPGTATRWTAATPLDGGWGCTDVASAAPELCANGTVLLAMAYAEVDPATGVATRAVPPPASFAAVGTIQGGVCLPAAGAAADAPLLTGGVCRCDGLARGRFRFPSSAALPGGAYDYDFQGWAGPACDIPCAPCSANGACAAADGACACHDGWTGYRCLVPCEPCGNGTCLFDGSCLCDGPRRRLDGSYALRLSRDPFFAERGVHSYDVAGSRRVEYVPPVYATAATVEDFLWEAEVECANRPDCAGRTPDTQLPARPNETYFRYSTPFAAGIADADSPAAKLAALDARIADLRAAAAAMPESMNGSALCDVPGPNVGLPSQGGDACILAMRARLWGRSLATCGPSYDAAQPWTCDDNVKAQFIVSLQAEVGRLLVARTQVSTNASLSSLGQTRWLMNNRNERQRLLNTQLRGIFNITSSAWVPLRQPDYYAVWIIHQLLYGVTTGGGYSGWDCSVPCDACDADGGTCQFDGSCECIPGRYGADCSLPCDCTSLEPGGGTAVSASGRVIAAGGVCARDGACVCYTDTTGISWAGAGCFVACAQCAHGACNATDGSCTCDAGWSGAACDLHAVTDCLACDGAHGVCLSDGTCTCDAGWTGLDCALPCLPCAHGDCQPDGACFCRPGWAGLDCSLHLGAPVARAAFAAAAGGWRAYNNSCGAADGGAAAPVRGADADAGTPAVAAPPGCVDPGAGGDGGLTWDAATGCLYLVDQLPADTPGQLAYLRAPPAFTGNVLAAYGGVLAWSLHAAGDAPPGAPHAPGAAPDAVLIGGLPGFNVTPPDLDALSKQGLYDWSRARFPELRLNRRWSRARVADTVGAYLRTPQLALLYTAPPGASPPPGCAAAECSLNFAAALAPGGGWRNAPPGWAPPGAWGWGDTGDPAFVQRIEGTPYLGGRATGIGGPYNPYPGFAAAVPPNPGGDAALAARHATPGTGPDGGVAAWTWQQGDGPAPGPLGPGPGVPLAADADGDNSYGVSIDAGRATWDVLPHVYDAIALARASRAGAPATAAELAWCLSSLKELLLRADYLNATAAGRAPAAGPGEAVRLDDVALTGPDPFRDNATEWEVAEAQAYLQYARAYAEAYNSSSMLSYVAQNG